MNTKWKDDMKEWGKIYCPFTEQWENTYYPIGVPPYSSYTHPWVDSCGNICCYEYDHDEGSWKDDIVIMLNEEDYEKLENVVDLID